MSRCFLWLAASFAFAISHRFVSRPKGRECESAGGGEVHDAGFGHDSISGSWLYLNVLSQRALDPANASGEKYVAGFLATVRKGSTIVIVET